jgi:class 3 adenylate cyclase/tetratricopeptide (TPR) repeat protein
MAICARCGEENPDRARFCLACAAPLAETSPQQAERKVVSVIFVDLVGFTAGADTADPEDVHATLQPYHARVREEIERLGGVVEKYVGDAVMAVFGAPVAREDDAERAVRAGLRVLAVTDELGLEARAAVNTGEALVALGARPELGEAMVAGDVVNTASRLQSAAETGSLVVGELTYRTTRDQIDYEPLAAVAVKGKSEPVQLWRATGPRSRFGVDVEIGGSTPLVGRDSELTLLKEAYARVRRDESVQLVTLVGEAGVGKTRLLRELGRWLDDEPDLVYWRQGRCLPYGEGIAFWALGEIVKAQAGILESDDPKAAAEKLQASVEAVVPDPAEQDWTRARLAPLVGVATDAAGTSREESFTAWRGYLEAVAAQRPLVLLIEDLHWADEALLEFLDHLIDWSLGVPMLVLCTARPELYELHESWGGGKRNATTVSLSALAPDDTARLLHALLDQSVLPAETQALLLERCGGNPLYAEQFARMLADSGEDAGVPETVQAVISARLDALGPARKALLQDAAVIGKVFWAEAVAEVSGQDDHTVLAALVDLAHRDLVRPARTSSVESKREFAFTHVLVRDVGYGQIPRAERARKHRLVAEWIETTVGERVADHAELLAYHYSEALELAKAAGIGTAETEPLRAAAVRMLLAAAKRAEVLDARRWVENLDRALQLASAEERPRVLLEHAIACTQVGRTREGRAELDEVIPVFEAAGDNIQLGRALSELSWVLSFTADAKTAEAAEKGAIAALEREPPGPELAFTYARATGMLMMAERSEDCLALCERVQPVVEQFGNAFARTMFHEFRGISRVATGEVELGLKELRDVFEEASRSGSPTAMAVFVNLGYWTWWVEGPGSGAELFRQGLEYAERRGIPFEWAETELAWTLFDLGEWDDVLGRTDRLVAGAQAADFVVLEAMARPTRGRILLARGRLDDARVDADASVALIRETDIPQSIVPALTLAAGVAAAGGDDARARELLEELEERTRGRARSRGIEAAEAARIAAAVGDTAAVERILTEPFPPVLRGDAQRLSARAVLAEASGALEEALALHTEAAASWTQFGHVFESAHAHAGAGRCALAVGADASDDLTEARRLFARLGANPHVVAVDDLLGGSAAVDASA